MKGDDSGMTQLGPLLQRVNAGQPGAFDDLVGRTTHRLHAIAHAMLRRFPHVRRWEDTDDVLQAALIRLHRALDQVKPEGTRAFIGLAVTQMRRELIDLARHYYGAQGHGAKHASQGGGKAADDSGGFLAQLSDSSEKPEANAAWAEFHEAIDALPDDEREAFSMVWYGGLLQKDVAALLDVSEKTIVRRLNRARLKLYDQLGGQSPAAE